MHRPVLGERRLRAARHPIPAKVVLFQVRRGHREHVAFPHARRESLKRVRGVFRRERPTIEVDCPLVFVGADVGMEGDDPLRSGVVVSPDAQWREPAECIVRRVRTALTLLHHRDTVRIPGLGAEPACLAERKPGVVTQFRTGNPLDRVLVVQGCPLPGEVHLCAGRQRRRQNRCSDPDGLSHVHRCLPRRSF